MGTLWWNSHQSLGMNENVNAAPIASRSPRKPAAGRAEKLTNRSKLAGDSGDHG